LTALASAALDLSDRGPVGFADQPVAHGFLAGLLEVDMAGLRQHLDAEEHAKQAVGLSLGRGLAQVHSEQLENIARFGPAARGCAVLHALFPPSPDQIDQVHIGITEAELASVHPGLPSEPSSPGLLAARPAAKLRAGGDLVQVGVAHGVEEVSAGPGPGIPAPIANQISEAGVHVAQSRCRQSP
jgi:hypothetical protein